MFIKGKKSILPITLSVFAFITCILFLTGGGGRETTGARVSGTDYLNMESEMPIVKEKITLHLVMPKDVGQGQASDIWFWTWAEKEMNIHFDITQIDYAGFRERVNLMLASNELPDIFFRSGFSTVNILNYGQKEGQLIPLNELIENYAPALNNFFKQTPSFRAQSTCPDGNIYFLPGVNTGLPQQPSSLRPWINMEWVNKLGLRMPETLDEFYNVLTAFRDRDPNGNGLKDEIPMIGSPNAMTNSIAIITAAFGFPEPYSWSPVVVNDQVKLFAASPLYGEYLRYMNRLFSEELLDNDFYTNTTILINAKATQMRVGVHAGASPASLTPDPGAWSQYEALSPMTSQWNSKQMWVDNADINIGNFAVTNVCKYPEAAIRFGDFFFTDKGSIYQHYGPPKDSPDLLGMHEGWFFDNTGAVVYNRPAEYGTDQDYRLGAISANPLISFGNNDFTTQIENMTGLKFMNAPNAQAWRDSMYKYIIPHIIPKYPIVYFNDEQNDRFLELSTMLSDYITMMDARFITGAEPLSNIPVYLDRIRSMGADELEKLYQDAYNIYRRNLGQ